MFIIYNVICIKVGIRGYTRFADSVYRANLPHHTYMSGVFGNGGKKFLELLADFCFEGRVDNIEGVNKVEVEIVEVISRLCDVRE